MLDPQRMEDVLRRGGDVSKLVDAWRSIDEQRRKLQGELDGTRQRRNAANEGMSKLDKKSPEFAATRDELKALSTRIKEGETQLAVLERDSEALLLTIPNAPHASVPDGADESANPVLHTWGEKPTFSFKPQAHWDVGEALGI
ncbi:MAG TPA: hypothetical protein VFQ65_15790, partial [Kofleriaceae bacterium]|nr:hypothetical protein [Kofleriaceae bacterium]